jgi:ABC-type dipeptide/oligopeptide/nickel transport system ATPase component
MTEPEVLLDIDKIDVRLGSGRTNLQLLFEVSLQVHHGEIVGVVGETGSGKSMTLRAIMGLLPMRAAVTSGRITLEGESLLGLSQEALRRKRGRVMSLIPQQPLAALNPILTIEDQFRQIARAHKRTGKKAVRERAVDLLEKVGLSDPGRVLASHAGELSGGMAQRVAIAMALYWNPRLLLADEPTTALDVTIQRDILDLVAQLAREEKRAVLLVSHDLGVVASYCQHVVVMNAGRIVEHGATHDVLNSPQAPYTRLLLEDSRVSTAGSTQSGGGGTE